MYYLCKDILDESKLLKIGRTGEYQDIKNSRHTGSKKKKEKIKKQQEFKNKWNGNNYCDLKLDWNY